MGTSIPQRRPRRRTPQRAVPQNIRRSGKPLFFGWGAHLTHHEREQVKERIAAGIGILLALAVVAILGGGAVYQYVVKPSQEAAAKQAAKAEQAKLNKQIYAIAGGVKINRGWYEATLKQLEAPVQSQISSYESAITQNPSLSTKYQSVVSQLQQQLQTYPQIAYNFMIANVVAEQKGPSIGAKTSPFYEAKYIKSILKAHFHSSASDFASAAQQAGMTPSQFRQFFLMRDYNFRQLTDVLDKRVKKRAEFVKVRHILIGVTKPTRSTFATTKAYDAALKTYRKQVSAARTRANKVLGLLLAQGNTNAAWKKLAAQYSTDGSKTKGGSLGWAQASTYVPSFKNASLNQPLFTDHIIRSVYGFHVIEVLGRKNKRLTSTELQTNQQQALNNWITKEEARKGYVVKKFTPPSSSGLGTPGSSSTVP